MSIILGRKALPAIVVGSLLAAASSANAGLAPDVQISLQASNGFNQVLNPAGSSVGGDLYNYDGATGDADFDFDFDFDVDGSTANSPDMFLGSGFTLVNNSGDTLEFTIELLLPLDDSAGPFADYGGSAGFTITGLEGILMSLGGPVWSAFADGALVDSAFDDPYMLESMAGGGSNSDSANVAGAIGGPVNNTLAVSFNFSLSGNTSLTHTGAFGVVPAPSVLALLGLAGVARRRRRA